MKTQNNEHLSNEERAELFKRKFEMIAEKKQKKTSRFSFRVKKGTWFSSEIK